MLTNQFLRFLIAGGLAAAFNFGSRFIFSLFFNYGLAVFCAYLVGMSVAFLLMRRRVFNAMGGSVFQQIYKFCFVNILAVLQTLAISLVLAHYLIQALGNVADGEAFAHLVGVLVPVVTSYFGHKFFTFRSPCQVVNRML